MHLNSNISQCSPIKYVGFTVKDDLQRRHANLLLLWSSISSYCNTLGFINELHKEIEDIISLANRCGAAEIYRIAKKIESAIILEEGKKKPDAIIEDEDNIVELLFKELKTEITNWVPGERGLAKKNSSGLVCLYIQDETLKNSLLTNTAYLNCDIKILQNLDELLSACQKVAPAVIIMDGNNTEDCKLEKEHIIGIKKLSAIAPIIYLSHQDCMDCRQKANSLNVYRFFSPPFDIPKIIYTLTEFISKDVRDKFKILIVDNEESVSEFYQTLEPAYNIEIKTISNRDDICGLMSDYIPEVIVMELNNFEPQVECLTDIIRHDGIWSDIPIIYLAEDSDTKFLNNGVDFYVTKPIDIEKFMAMLMSIANRRRNLTRLYSELNNVSMEKETLISTMNNHNLVSVADKHGTIIYANDTFSKVSGYTKDELVGRDHRLLKSGIHPASFYKEIWETISKGNIWRGTICNRSKSGRTYWVDSTIAPFMDSSGKPYKYVSVRSDITNLRDNEIRFKSSQVFSKIGTWDWNIQTGDLFWSERVGILFGYGATVPETTYENFVNAIHPQDRDLVLDAIQRCVHHKETYNVEHRVVWPDGSVHWVHESGDVIRNDLGEPVHMLGVVQDINARKIAEQELLDREFMLNEAQSLACLGNRRRDVLTGQTVWSDHLFRILGMVPGSIDPSTFDFFSVVHKEDHQKLIEASKLRDKTGFSDVTYRIILPNGSIRHMHELGKVEHDKHGNKLYLHGTIQDITQRVSDEKAYIQAREEAEKANSAKSDFLSSMSHEIRTPLNAIVGFSQLITLESGNNLSESQIENLNEIKNASDHLLTLINGVLDLSKIESGRVELTLEPISVGAVVMETLNLIQPLILNSSMEIKCIIDGVFVEDQKLLDDSRKVWADHVRLRQSLLNLLTNAVKYSDVDSIIEVEITRPQVGIVRVGVKDSGIGISTEQQAKLFKPFSRFGSRMDKVEGSGIGLVITKELVELMGGHIGYTSKKDIGSTFWFDLPEACTNGDKEMAENIELAENIDKQNTQQRSVLYIEDNPANLRLITQLLARLPNIHMWSAHEPTIGLELAEKHCPDLILLDISLPYMDGFEVLKRLRCIDSLKNTPVFAISANAMADDIQKGLDAGFCKYITKPIDVTSLLSSVKDVLNS